MLCECSCSVLVLVDILCQCSCSVPVLRTRTEHECSRTNVLCSFIPGMTYRRGLPNYSYFASEILSIVDALPQCIEKQIPHLQEYLENRFVSSKQLQKLSRVPNRKLKEDTDSIDEGFYIDCIDLWPDNEKLKEKVLEESKSGTEI